MLVLNPPFMLHSITLFVRLSNWPSVRPYKRPSIHAPSFCCSTQCPDSFQHGGTSKVLHYLRAPGTPFVCDKFWTTRSHWERKLRARPLYTSWPRVHETLKRNLRANLQRVLEQLALKQKDGVSYENVVADDIRQCCCCGCGCCCCGCCC